MYCTTRNVGGQMVAIKFCGFENITIWQRFNLEILLEESGWGPYFYLPSRRRPGVIGSDVPWLECPACNALTWVIAVTE